MADKYLGESIGKLGFGFMRLPRLESGEFDMELTKSMVDKFLESGFTYFDTAYVYQGSEVALRQALVERHPRGSYTIASKLPIVDTETPERAREIFEESLKRLGIDYFDFYLLHAINGELYEKSERLEAWELLRREKAAGRIRHIGFSSHGKPEEIDKMLTEHPEVEFVQLQINYLDWEDAEVQSRECWETVRRHGKSVVIMEPVKGGMLASTESPAAPVLRAYAPERSVASWAIRFAATRGEGLITALSGMNSMEQVEDNVKTVSGLKPFSDTELETLQKAVEVFKSVPRVPCTGCKYCVDNCPQKIKIPEIMKIYNDYLAYQTTLNSDFKFMLATKDAGLPSSCVKCRSCEEHCPQRINITEILEKAAALYETR